jgi:hypothetical protein
MKYDEFLFKLDEYKSEFHQVNNRDIKTIQELEEFLKQRKYGRKPRRTLKSLKHIGM